MKKKICVGIDSGTTNHVIAVVDEFLKEAICIANEDGEYLTPSVVSFYSQDEILIGQTAYQNAMHKPDRTKKFVKRDMGKKKIAISVDENDYSPQQITALIIKRLVKDVEDELDVEVGMAVITVPAYFDDNQRKAVEEAGKLAGIPKVVIVDEPSAISVDASVTYDLDGQTILVYDFGGGTTDFVVLSVEQDAITEHIIDGDNNHGGCDWDQATATYLKEHDLKGYTLDVDCEQELLLKVEMAKKTLSKKDEAKFTVGTNEGRVELSLTREKFKEITVNLLEKQRMLLENVIKKMEEKGIVLDKVIMSGGSSRMPQIYDLVQELFPNTEIITTKDVDCSVARGAAIYANSFNKESKVEAKELRQVSSRSYGIAAYSNDELKIFNMIMQNDAIPVEIEEPYYTRQDNQKEVRLRVFENTKSDHVVDLDEGNEIGVCHLQINGNLKKGSKILVKLRLEKDGTLHLRGREETGQTEINEVMETKALLTKEEFDIQKEQLEELLLLV